MSKKKKYYWLKQKEDFFRSHIIEALRNDPDGFKHVFIYQSLLSMAVRHDGAVSLKDGSPFNIKVFSASTRIDLKVIERTIERCIEYDFIRKLEDGTLFMLDIQDLIGSEADSTKRTQEYREQIKKAKTLSDTKASHVTKCDVKKSQVTKCDTEIETETETETENRDKSKIQSKKEELDLFTEKKAVTTKKQPLKKTSKKFIPPTLEEVTSYIEEHKITNIDPKFFVDKNNAVGWVSGKAGHPIKCWKSVIQTWKKYNFDNKGDNNGQGTGRSTKASYGKERGMQPDEGAERGEYTKYSTVLHSGKQS